MDIVVLAEDHHDDIEEDQDSDFISTEHVSLTQELQQQQAKALVELENILGEFELSDEEGESYDRTDLLSVIQHLHRTVNKYKLRTPQSHHDHHKEEEEESDRAEEVNMIDVDNITDEKLKLEAELRNREVRLESLESKVEKLRLILKEKDFKLTAVTCQLTTAELKMKLLEEQIEIFEKDLTRGTSSDNLSDAIEVFKHKTPGSLVAGGSFQMLINITL